MQKELYFIDLFAGCGGLSLGLIEAGFKGLFAIEKTADAFETLKHNLCDKKAGFNWPQWLPCEHMTTNTLLENYEQNLKKIKGKVFLIAGGPPCQGFSFAGLRNPNDPRNTLTEEYIKIVTIVRPKILLLENVRGFQVAFKGSTKQPYAEKVAKKLDGLGYKVFKKVLSASLFGVPQPRARFIMIAVDRDYFANNKILKLNNDIFFKKIENKAEEFKQKNSLDLNYTKLGDAISDLEITNKKIISCVDSSGFKQIKYVEPENKSPYLKLMREGLKKTDMPNSLRLPNHKKETLRKFEYIIKHAEKGSSVPQEIKNKFNLKKQCLNVLCPNKLSTTITTLPDDTLHYKEPRILTVRENARLQSFPDWFEFKGKYTTGGDRRKLECPRYTQVGNAVPPLMAKVLGQFIMELAESESK